MWTRRSRSRGFSMAIKLLLPLLVVAAFFGIMSAPAQAAISCPSEHLGLAVYNAGGGGTVGPTSWSATCNGAQWTAEFILQYQVNGDWNQANCVNSTPCGIRRPSTGFYSAGSSHSGNVTFDPLNGCFVRFRILMSLVGKGGNGFTF